jgi:phage terminase large subunit-like protein
LRRLNKKALLDYLESDAPQDKKREVAELVEAYDKLLAANPLEGFEPHSRAQREFFEASTPIQAAFAGNRFGKSSSMIVKALIHCCDLEAVPEHLRQYRYPRFKHDRAPPPCSGRVVVPGQSEGIYDVILPILRRWAPKAQLLGGSIDKAFEKQHRMLRFKNGSSIQFMSYEMDLGKFGGPAKHFIAYDEPPPEDIREECLWRLADYAGFEMFAMTPLGLDSNAGWINKRIYKRARRDPDITLVRGSIHDNPTVDEQTKNRILESRDPDDPVRQAREWGKFVAFGGLVYDDGFEGNLIDAPSVEFVKSLDDVLVAIDPGIRNAGIVWVGIDQDNIAWVFDCLLLKNETPVGYAKAIRERNVYWGVKDPLYVIDPNAAARSPATGETVEGGLNREGIYCAHGQNDVAAGLQQVRDRLRYRHLFVNRELLDLREEAEEYRLEERPDGSDKVVKRDDHRLDALRYAVMQRPYRPPEKPVKQVARPWGVATPPPRVHEAVAPTGSMT